MQKIEKNSRKISVTTFNSCLDNINNVGFTKCLKNKKPQVFEASIHKKT